MLALLLIVAVQTAETPPEPDAAVAQPAKRVIDVVTTSVLISKTVIVERTDGSVVAGTLVEVTAEALSLVLPSGREVRVAAEDIARYREKAIEPVTPPPDRRRAVRIDDEPDERPRRRDRGEARQEAEAASALVEAQRHSDIAFQWFAGAGLGVATSATLCAGWLFVVANPACLVGAVVGMLTAGVSLVVGLVESSAAAKETARANAIRAGNDVGVMRY